MRSATAAAIVIPAVETTVSTGCKCHDRRIRSVGKILWTYLSISEDRKHSSTVNLSTSSYHMRTERLPIYRRYRVAYSQLICSLIAL